MTSISAERIAAIEARRDELQNAMSSGNLAADEFVRLSKDYAEIEPVATAAREVRRLRAELSEDSLVRLARNPMRILDSKDPRDRPAADSAPDIDQFLTPDARAFFDKVTAGLDAAGVAWTRNPRLVRGLDYYRHTAFEFVTDRLGAQGAVIAGGRYDGLIESLGGPPTPAVGWAAGIERLGMMIDVPAAASPDAVLVPLGDQAEQAASGIIAGLRREGLACEMAFKGNMKKRMARADASGARFAIILGEDELGRGEVSLKRLRTGEQRAVAIADLAEAVRAA